MREFKTAAVSSSLFLWTLCSLNVLVGAQYRLPDTTEPLSYDVVLIPTLEDGQLPFSFQGSVAINVAVRRSTTTVVMHANQLEILELRVSSVNENLLQNYTLAEDDTHFLVINLNREVIVDETLTVNVRYEGKMLDDMYGWYRSWYMEGNTKKWLASTQFEATHARRALPCYDEPAFKAPFKFTFVIPEGLNILFNTKMTSEANGQDDNTTLVAFATTPPMSAYLLAFVLSEFETLPGNEKYSVWSRRENVQQTQYAQSIMGPTVNAMENMVGVAFETGTIDKLHTVAVPDFSSGAMENWGLVTYREQRIQWEEGVSSERNKQALAAVVAHEIAHQWFGDLVSPSWWSYLWLNEGFATYFEFFACHEVEKTWRMDEQFVVSSLQDALRADGFLSSNPLTHEVDSPSSISAKFDTISYEKGGSVIRMMELFLGTNLFRQGLTVYLRNRQLLAATDDDLFDALDQVVNTPPAPTTPLLPDGVSVKDVMYTWVRKAGYPVITVERNYTANSVAFSQKRFLYSESDDQSVWHVPLTMTSMSEPDISTDTKLWLLTQGPLEISYNATASEWILVNVNQSGFYRVNYDTENWRLIAQQLQTTPDDIPPVMRAQLVDDALNLARGGVLNYSIALDMTRFLRNEMDFIPWASALTALSFLDGRLYGSETYSLFQKYLRLLLEKVSNQLGYTESTSTPVDHVDRLHRNQIATWACNHGIQKCLDAAKSQFQAYRTNTSNRVGPDMKSVVYCHGLLQGGQEDWDFLWGRYLATQTATEQMAILTALGCSNNNDTLNGYLLKSIADNDDIRRQDALTVFSSTYSRSVGLEVALKFVGENLNNITNRYGGLNVIRSVVSGIASRLSTNDQIKMVETAFVNIDLTDPTLNATVVSALESARKNVEWTESNRATIHDWLKKEVGASSVATLSVLLLVACFLGLAAL